MNSHNTSNTLDNTDTSFRPDFRRRAFRRLEIENESKIRRTGSKDEKDESENGIKGRVVNSVKRQTGGREG